jgi:hypothetical protein
MEVKDLVPIVVLFCVIGMLLGVGLLTLDKFGRSVRDSTNVASTGLNLSIAGTVDFTTTYCTAVMSITNATVSFSTAGVNLTSPDGCIVEFPPVTGCGPALANYCNMTYTYGASNPAVSALSSTESAISPVATTWLPLLITVIVLSVILGLVVRSFAMGGRG